MMMSEAMMLQACQEASLTWLTAFNQQDAEGCAAQYSEDSVMHARPFGVYQGRRAIAEFWQSLMDNGYRQVTYSNVQWVPTKDGYVLTAHWNMNKAFGVIHKELWVIEKDGKARLKSDDFEVMFSCPLASSDNEG